MTARLAIIFGACAVIAAGQEAVDIVRKSVQADQRTLRAAKDYSFQETQVERNLDGAGRVLSTESRTYDVIVLYGRPFRKLVARNGAPLTPAEQAKVEARLQKAIDQRRSNAGEEDSEQRDQKERSEMRRVAGQLPESHNLTLLGSQAIGGRAAWIVQAEPKPGYKPFNTASKAMSKMRGKLWIDQADYHWVKFEADVLDTITAGFGLARLNPGTHLEMEQARINDEIWAPVHFRAKVDARLALLKKFRREMDIEFRDYRKFKTDSRVIEVSGEAAR